MESKIALKDLVTHLRSELVEATSAAEGQVLRFGVESVDIELKVQVTRSDSAEGGVKFWVVNAGASLKDDDVVTQALKIRLTPGWVDSEGRVQTGWLISD